MTATARKYEWLPRRTLTPALNSNASVAVALEGLPATLHTVTKYGALAGADGELTRTPTGHLAHTSTTGEVTDLTVADLGTYSHVTVDYDATDLRGVLIATLAGE